MSLEKLPKRFCWCCYTPKKDYKRDAGRLRRIKDKKVIREQLNERSEDHIHGLRAD